MPLLLGISVREGCEKMSESTEYGENDLSKPFAWEYSQLGALAWLDIPEEELTHMLSAYSVLPER